MEEVNTVQVITIFLSSNLIQQLNFQLNSLNDQPFQCFAIKNYSTYSFQLPSELQNFYCITTSLANGIEEQFQCDFSENINEHDKTEVVKSFGLFKLKIEAQIIKQYQVASSGGASQKLLSQIYNIAAKNIIDLERKLIHKMEVEQLRKPIKNQLDKFYLKGKASKKSKTNMELGVVGRLRLSLQKFQQRNQKSQENIRFYQDQIPSQSDMEDQNVLIERRIKRGLKHKTYVANKRRDSNQSIEKATIRVVTQQKCENTPYLERMYKKINGYTNKIEKQRFSKGYKSIFSEMYEETKNQLETQKQIIHATEQAVNFCFQDLKNSIDNSHLLKSKLKKISPYKLYRSKAFKKMKII